MAKYCFEFSKILLRTMHAAVRTVGMGSDPIKPSNDGVLCVAKAIDVEAEVVKNFDQ
jgi:hypothetical protein